MKRTLACFGAFVSAFLPAQQQSNAPHLGYVYPAGGRQGQVVEAVIGGQRLVGAARVLAGPGVQAAIVDYVRPMTPKELQETRDKLEAAAKRLGLGGSFRTGSRGNPAQFQRVAAEAGLSEKDLKRFLAFIRERSDPKRQPNPQLAETIRLRIEIAKDAQPGLRELRIVSPLGLSNPIRFYVGQDREFNEIEPNNVDPCQLDGTIPIVVNGQVMPGEQDAFAVHLKKGQTVQISAMARAITPYLADAVPGWFQAHLSLRDPDGREVAYADHDDFNQGPSLRYTPVKDGRYVVSIRDTIYRGREDFVYRLYIGPPIPEAKALFPQGMPEKEPNNSPAQSAIVSLPSTVNGAIGSPGDADCFRFRGAAGERFAIEVTARRCGSPLDASIVVTDAVGRVIAFNDDFVDKSAALITHQADPYVLFTLPSAGVYCATVRDTQGRAGPDYRYSLRLGRAEPDFELRVVPSSVTLRPGVCTPVTVFALRKDGFDGEIRLQLDNAPKGISLSGGPIPAGSDKVRVTLRASSGASEPLPLHMSGVANVAGKPIMRRAVPAEDMMQAFAYRHLVPVSSWLVTVAGRGARAAAGFSAPEAPVKIPVGGTAQVRLAGPGRLVADALSFELSDPPEGLTLKGVKGVEGALLIELQADPSKLRAGTKGNLIVDVFLQQTNALAKRPNARKTLVGCLPAIAFEVVK